MANLTNSISKCNAHIQNFFPVLFNDTDVKSLTVEQLLEMKRNATFCKIQIAKLSDDLQLIIDDCEKFILEQCEHDWAPDRTMYDPCATYYICLKCRLNK